MLDLREMVSLKGKKTPILWMFSPISSIGLARMTSCEISKRFRPRFRPPYVHISHCKYDTYNRGDKI